MVRAADPQSQVPPSAAEAQPVAARGTWDGLPVGRRLLVAEDDSAMRDLLALVLRERGYQVATVNDGAQLRNLLSTPDRHFDLIIADVNMPGGSGLDVIDRLRQAGDTTPVLIVTAFPLEDIRQRARGLEVRLLAKPFDLDTLRSAVDREIRSNAPHQQRMRWWQ
jgi:DNA-binding response OmpR family regulator